MNSDLAVPDAIASAHAAALRRFAAPGAFLDGATRRAVVEAAREARTCALCAARREALSPAAVGGDHDGDTALPTPLRELTHRLVTDPARVTTAWFESLLATGLTREQYVEAAGLIGASTIVDTYTVAMIGALPALAPAVDGDPSRETNPNVVDDGARVPIMDAARPLPPWDQRPGPGKVANIVRALALVPFAQHDFWDTFTPHYRPMDVEPGGPIGRPQIEFVASRTSSLNECFY